MSKHINDAQFEDTTITSVRAEADGWSVGHSHGFSFWVKSSSPVEPKVGMSARFYGKGIGFPVRGLFLEDQEVFYRTEAEDEEKREIDLYGADATEWLRRWDAGDTVWSISMGGLGPGYEQCIQITTAEVLRHLLERKYGPSTWEDRDAWETDRKAIENDAFANPRIDALGLSGAQWGAAMNLALQLYRRGPRGVMTDDRVKDRHIQVRRTFPGHAAA